MEEAPRERKLRVWRILPGEEFGDEINFGWAFSMNHISANENKTLEQFEVEEVNRQHLEAG